MRFEFSCHENWHNRGYLPHYDASNKYQMITYRLADSLPQVKIKALDEIPIKQTLERRKRIETFLDQGYGSCILQNENCAKTIIESWQFFDKQRYDIIAYVVMPNHVHLMIKTYDTFKIGQLVKTWKSRSIKEIRKHFKNADCQSALPAILQVGEPFWQREYWDRFIRDENHFIQAVNYIHENPVKAGLCNSPEEWQWSSIHLSNI